MPPWLSVLRKLPVLSARRAGGEPSWQLLRDWAKVLIRRPGTKRGAKCGRSAAGSASPCQGEGRGFESRRPLGVRPRHNTRRGSPRWSGREARQRPAKPCTRVQIPSPPRHHARAIGAVGARFLDTEEVTGSNPVSPTRSFRVISGSGSDPFRVQGVNGSAQRPEPPRFRPPVVGSPDRLICGYNDAVVGTRGR
jgi:hypothetical protein